MSPTVNMPRAREARVRGGRLGDLVHEFDSGTDRRIFSTLSELESHLDALRANTKQFNGELQRLLRADGTDLATFHEVKASTVAYLEEFLTNLDYRSHAIAARVQQVEQHGVGLMHKRALAGADLPKLAGADPGPAWLEHRRARWAGARPFRPRTPPTSWVAPAPPSFFIGRRISRRASR